MSVMNPSTIIEALRAKNILTKKGTIRRGHEGYAESVVESTLLPLVPPGTFG